MCLSRRPSRAGWSSVMTITMFGSPFGTSRTSSEVLIEPAEPQRTVIGQRPGAASLPRDHVHVTLPATARFGLSEAARMAPRGDTTVIPQVTLAGETRTLSVTEPPG